MTKPTYTSKDAGCYVDSARGVNAVDQIINIVRHRNFTIRGTRCFHV